MKKHLTIRALSVLLVVALLAGLTVPVMAADSRSRVTFTQVDNSAVSVSPLDGADEELNTPDEHIDTDIVRVSIFLEDQATLSAGYSLDAIAANAQAMSYRDGLKQKQAQITAAIEARLGEKLDVVWNLTLAANLISANVPYGQIEAIAAVPGVRDVLLETLYSPAVVDQEETNDPMMSTSSAQIGSAAAWSAGYTGAGTRIAVIDTGADTDHQSLDPDAFLYSLKVMAQQKGMDAESYIASLDLLDAEEIAALSGELNAPVSAEAYINAKIPFGYNYIDGDLDVTHDNDDQGSHGSHVSGIALANAYVPSGDGFADALTDALMQGVAPDAQLISMKVFGKSGGAYDSDYMAAIEDAAVLGCDACNLSLGTGNPGNGRHATAEYQAIMDNLTECGMVVAIATGNEGAWSENVESGVGLLYAEDVSMDAVGAPGSFTNSLAVASVDNDGATGCYIQVGDQVIVYNESLDEDFSNVPFTTIAGEHEYVLITGIGSEADWAALGDALKGRIAICSRGEINFTDKCKFAVDAGAIATFIYDNQPGVINMDMSDYPYTEPAAYLTQKDGQRVMAASTAVTGEDGEVLYYTGTMTVSSTLASTQYGSDYYSMSSFSSWGVPGTLEMKPEITAPGGSIYSLNGVDTSGTAYEVASGTSMACPQIAGMAALVAQYIRENALEAQTGLTARQLAQSLLMSTAVPVEAAANTYYSILQQGSGLANVSAAVTADSYITMDEGVTSGASDGKVKVELGDDPQRTGSYSASFTITNLTDEEKAFDLGADFFIQAPVSDGTYTYMDTATILVGADVKWTVDGREVVPAGCYADADLNGDGLVNSDDGQAILDHATGITGSLTSLDQADVDGDGDVDSYDAYLFLKDLNTVDTVLPASGSISVQVEFTLSEDTRALIDASFPNGTYVQGFLFARSESDAEGVSGTSHSIPVLGFYGSWTDPSMFDVGQWTTYATGEDTRTPYIGRTRGNDFKVTYADAYFDESFGGNPVIPDESYMPERNAINALDAITGVSFVAIRNAAASRFTAVNETTGQVIVDAETGPVSSAYFYSGLGAWYNSGMTLGTNIILDGYASEGDVVTMDFTLVPEYYVDADGSVAWEALGDGATFSTSMTVDNTAPQLEELYFAILGNELIVTASDNEYIAAVGLYNKTGTKKLSITGAKQDIEKGESATYKLSLDGINGKKFLLQVMDYAMNTTTYLIEMQIGEEEPLPDLIAYDNAKKFWAGYDKYFEYNYTTGMPMHADADFDYCAATIVDHYVFAATTDGDLYVMPEKDFSDTTFVVHLETVLTDMAYNKADDTIYGVNEKGSLVTINKLTGDMTTVGTIGVQTNTLACDENGTFYCNRLGTSSIYSFTLDTLDQPQILVANMDAEVQSQYMQSMEIDPNTGMLFWHSFYKLWDVVNFSWLFEIDPATGTFTKYNDFWHEMTALVIPLKSEEDDSWTAPTDTPSGIKLSRSEVTVLKGTTTQLTANVQPWTATDRTVTWSTSDPSVAVVDKKGVITGVTEGTAVITATSNLDPAIYAECVVTVELLQVTISGTLQDADGTPMFYSWNMASDESWTGGAEIETTMTSATYSTREKAYYIMDAVSDSWSMHKVGTDGKIIETAANPNGIALWDMTYNPFFTSFHQEESVSSIYYYYLLSPKNPMAMNAVGFNLGSYVEYLTGITSLGYETFRDQGVSYNTEHLVLLDSDGYVWDFWIYDYESGMNAFYSTYASDLPCEFPGDDTMENMYTSLLAGEDGALYLSAFNGETNELYRLVFDESSEKYLSTKIGEFGEGVWPATITSVTANTAVTASCAAPAATGHMTAEQISAEELSAASLSHRSAVCGMTDQEEAAKAERYAAAETEADAQTVTVQVTAGVLATNGVFQASWDAGELELIAISSSASYTAVLEAEGAVRFGYVSLSGIKAGEPIATLTFEAKKTGSAAVIIEHQQLNNGEQHICPSAGFTDVSEADWFHEAVDYVVSEGLMKGVSETQFSPAGIMNRAQIVTVLYRMAGSPQVADGNAFADVPADSFYADAVTWAVEQGITNGVSATAFNPEGAVSREQMVTFLYRYAKLSGEDVAITGDLSAYTDAADVSTWAAEPMTWAVEQGVISGMTADTLVPAAATNRAQVATVLMRFCA